MSAIAAPRPFSQYFFWDLSASSSSQESGCSSQSQPAVRSHYRPYSTLDTKAEVPARAPSRRNSVLLKVRRQSAPHRSASLGDAMGLGKKKAGEKVLAFQVRKLSDISPSTVAASTKVVSRPSTSSGGLTVAGQRNFYGKSTLHRVKAQRSIGSLFATAAADVSLNLEHPKPHSPTTPPLCPRKMDGAPAKPPRNPSNLRLKDLRVKVDIDDDNFKKRDAYLENNVWLTRSRTKVHPYTKEVPYMQAYDIPCMDNDRYSELLLERLNPQSPSFHDFGEKPPLAILDLGCGQGHWVLYAASLWSASLITGFDLMNITSPAFQTTVNVNFVRGNFLLKLPFPAKSFDYVRMANLSLCIPYDHWLPLLTEVRRILTSGGRLEIIDDQILFPYGEEPRVKDPCSITDAASIKADSPIKASFFDFSDDSDSQGGIDSDTLEETLSTTSTLVSERGSTGFFDKLPSSKRSSAQSNASTSVDSECVHCEANQLPISSVMNSIPLEPTISPSPTVTQATFTIHDPDRSTISQYPTITARKHHKKTLSSASTRSNAEALSTWKSKKASSVEMEVIFEHVLVHEYGIHPRPSEFIVDTMRAIFGKGNAGKVKSFHIKLAPFDSPIGPGGTFAPPAKVDPVVIPKAEKTDKKHWKAIEKKEKKERKRERKNLEKPDSPMSSINEPISVPMIHPVVVSSKAADRLGLLPIVSTPRHISTENSTGSESSASSSSSKSKQSNITAPVSYFPVVSTKVANRLGIPVSARPPIPPKSAAIRHSYINRPRVLPNHHVVGTPPEDFGPLSPFTEDVLDSSGGSDIDRDLFSSGLKTSHSEQSSSSSELADDNAAQPPVISAKAAGRLGISYSVLAAASAAHSRSSGVMDPVQSPGILVWPSTYIPISPAELEMHSCKHVQTLLGCRHALHEFLMGEFDGQRLVDEADFEEAIWNYECFRRSRFLWPNDNPDLFDEDGFPESPTVMTANIPQQSRGKYDYSRDSSLEFYNGQYRRDDLTHIRTIRVFEAVKLGDEKGLVSILFPSHPRLDKNFY